MRRAKRTSCCAASSRRTHARASARLSPEAALESLGASQYQLGTSPVHERSLVLSGASGAAGVAAISARDVRTINDIITGGLRHEFIIEFLYCLVLEAHGFTEGVVERPVVPTASTQFLCLMGCSSSMWLGPRLSLNGLDHRDGHGGDHIQRDGDHREPDRPGVPLALCLIERLEALPALGLPGELTALDA